MSEEKSVPLDFARLAPPEGARIAIIGACGGIGQAVTRASVAIGLKIAALDLARSLDEAPPPEGIALSAACDATNEHQVSSAFARVAEIFGGALDGLVNLAGFPNRFTSFDDLSSPEWEETVAGSLRTAWLGARAALPLLRRAAEKSGGTSAIVNTASGLATRPLPGFAPYSAAKAAVVALGKTIAQEAAPLVRINTLAPGVVETPFHTGGTGRPPDAPNTRARIDREAYRRTVPLGRIAEPEDLVGPILFLLGPAARWVNGQTIHVNGGGQMP